MRRGQGRARRGREFMAGVVFFVRREDADGDPSTSSSQRRRRTGPPLPSALEDC